MTITTTIRAQFHRFHDGREPGIGELSGPMVMVSIGYATADHHSAVIRRYRVVLRNGPAGRWINVTLARSGASIGQIKREDYEMAGTAPYLRNRPQKVAQAAIDRLCHAHGREAVADTMTQSEHAGPVCNPEILALEPMVWTAKDATKG